jgi:hypothetical protein
VKQVEINHANRLLVYRRSAGRCELCREFEAAHLHHLTYERAGNELPEDLEHICIGCHCAQHPNKIEEILEWEKQRRDRIAKGGADAVQETFDEWLRLAYEDYPPDPVHEIAPPDPIQKIVEPAWNLRHYRASGYSIEDVEREERSW